MEKVLGVPYINFKNKEKNEKVTKAIHKYVSMPYIIINVISIVIYLFS